MVLITVVKALGIGLAVLAAFWAALFLLQRRIMFPAPAGFAGAPDLPNDARQVWLESEAGRTEAWLLPPLTQSPRQIATPLLVFAHGNGEVIDHWPRAFDEPRRWGLAVLLVEYPGYGRSAGSPSETSIRSTFRSAYDWSIGQQRFDESRIIGYGRSIGGGVMANLSLDRPLAALVLESTFTSTRAFARRFLAPPFLVRDRFDNLAAIAAFDGPVFVVHGRDDHIVPVDHGRALARTANVPILELPCGHNDCPPAWRQIRAFLEESGML